MSILQANGAGLGGAGDPGGALAGGVYSYNIDQSLRFNDNDTAYLNRTPASAGNRKTWTWSGWVKRGNLSTWQTVFSAGTGSDHVAARFVNSTDKFQFYNFSSPSYNWKVDTVAVFRDVSAWYHLVLQVDSTQATSTDRIKIYINGERQTLTGSYPSLNFDSDVNSTNPHKIGVGINNDFIFDGYLSEVNFIDGTALDATSFGETVNGVWVPKAYDTADGAYGTNGFYLSFADSSAIGDDLSGNTNDWTANNLAASDVVPDSPTNGFATYNPLPNSSSFRANLSNGNLYNNPGNNCTGFGTIALTTGKKWYMEGIATNAYNTTMGIFEVNDANAIQNSLNTIYYNNTSYKSAFYHRDGTKYIDGANSSYGAAFTTGDLIGMAVDLESATNTITFYKNNVSQGSFNLGANGLDYLFCMSRGSSGGGWHMNFGQDDTFSDSKTSGSAEAQDANGIGDFYYTPPADHLALCSANLPEVTIGPNSAEQADDYFNTVLYTGDGTTGRAITTGIAADFIWIKRRDSSANHHLVNTVAGVTKYMHSNTTGSEGTDTNRTTSSDSTSFTVGSNATVNASSGTYVAWNWKAGGTAVSNTDGSITSQVSAAPDAGFSIVSYTGTGANATVGHGLSNAPEMVIVKERTSTSGWFVYTSPTGAGSYLNLHSTAASSSSTTTWNNTAPTSSVFSVGTSGGTNQSSQDYIAYCFHSSDVCKVGSYVGNGSTDGTFVYTGFRPAWFMLKRLTSGAGWSIFDDTRNAFNPSDTILQANTSNADGTSYPMDFVSNGVKIRNSDSTHNQSGVSYIYLAFAEAPFKYANAR